MALRELTDGQDVDVVALVRHHEARAARDGSPYLVLALADRHGQVQAVVHDGVAECLAECERGVPVRVAGRFRVHARHGARVEVRELRAAHPGEFAHEDRFDGPPRSAAQMEADLRELIGTVQSRHLRDLLDTVFGPSTETWAAFRIAPAAKRYHQAYRHGLLEHSLTVAQAVSSMSATFPGIDRDVAVTGALLHDIGKLDAYTTDSPAIEMTDSGRLHGHIPLGYYRIRRLIEDLPAFPADCAAAVLHIILAHHGALEHGSPVLPCTREATLVHFCDNLGGRLGSFDRLEKELPDGAAWSGFDRALGGAAHFAQRVAA